MQDQNLYGLVQEQAAIHPDRIAVIDEDGSTTYAELADQASSLAFRLRPYLENDEDRVGIVMHRNRYLVSSLLGILKAGGAYVPMEASDPPQRNAVLARQSGCRLILGNQDLLDGIKKELISDGVPTIQLIDVDSLRADSGEDKDATYISQPGDGSKLAYVMYTSGSTGQPKGVEIEHQNVNHLLTSARDMLGFGTDDRSIATAALSFDLSIPEIFLPLITGGSVVVASRNLILNPVKLASDIRRHEVTMFHTGPSVWSVILKEIPDFPRVRIASTTGEAVRPELAELLKDKADFMWNLYGPTETTVWACGHLLTGGEPEMAKSGKTRSTVSAPIGKALQHVDLCIVDENGGPVSDGKKGELWIGGPALSRGYHGRQDLTDEQFCTFKPNGPRWYRTGDIVALDSSGNIQYFGRDDDQLSIRGVRIEPMEVESAVASHADVQSVAATWYQSSADARSIVVAVIPINGVQIDESILHAHVSVVLPASMQPSRYIFCETFPLTSGGKIDRKAIRARISGPESSGNRETEPEHVATSLLLTDTEERLAQIWQTILGQKVKSAKEHFLSTGGDSLSAVTVMLHVEREFDVSMSVKELFEADDLRDLARRIDKSRSQTDEQDSDAYVFPLVKEGVGPPLFFCHVDLKLGQRGMWTPRCPLYSISFWAQDHGFVTADSVEELAMAHIGRIKLVQPIGPYRIAGHSFGGLVALEVARKLKQGGDAVDFLFLLDPTEPQIDESIAGFKNSHRLVRKSRNALAYVATKWTGLPAWERFCYRIAHLRTQKRGERSARLLPRNRWPEFWYAIKRLGNSYVARPYSGRVSIVSSDADSLFSSWKPILDPDAEYATVQSHNNDPFTAPAISDWMATVGGLLQPAVAEISVVRHPDEAEPYVERALALAYEGLEAGDGPAGCVIVRDGEILAASRAFVHTNCDATAHSELLTVREACDKVGSTRLDGAVMYTTLEPCPMCAAAALHAGITEFVSGLLVADLESDALGDYSLESLARSMGRSVTMTSGVRREECRELLYSALDRVRKTDPESGGFV